MAVLKEFFLNKKMTRRNNGAVKRGGANEAA